MGDMAPMLSRGESRAMALKLLFAPAVALARLALSTNSTLSADRRLPDDLKRLFEVGDALSAPSLWLAGGAIAGRMDLRSFCKETEVHPRPLAELVAALPCVISLTDHQTQQH